MGLNESQPVHIVIVHKRHALGQYLAVIGEERHHVDTRLQRLFVDEGHRPLIVRQVHGIVIIGMPARSNAQSQHPALGPVVTADDGLQLIIGLEYTERVATLLRTGQVKVIVPSLIVQPQLQSVDEFLGIERVGRHRKDTASGIVGLEVADAVTPSYQGTCHVQRASLGIAGLEGDAGRHTPNQIAAFGIEVNLQFVLGCRCHG